MLHFLTLIFVSIASLPLIARAQNLDRALAVSNSTQQESKVAQKRIDKAYEAEKVMYAEYQRTLAELKQLSEYHKALENSLNTEKKQLIKLQHQLESLKDAEAVTLPLLQEMLTTLRQFVSSDLPFKTTERLEDIDSVKAALADGDKTLSYKFEKVVAAYTNELSYGASYDTYRDTIELGSEERQFTLFRVGRIGLFFVADDNSHAGYFDTTARTWRPLETRIIPELRQAIQLQSGAGVPRLVSLPITVAAQGASR